MTTQRHERYLGAYALCTRDGHVLLARIAPHVRYDAGAWTLPGGGVNADEHPDDAVLRELTEETGLTGRRGPVVTIHALTHTRSPERPAAPLQHIGIVYEVAPDDGELVAEVGGSTDRCAWIPLSDLATLELVPLAADVLARAGLTDG